MNNFIADATSGALVPDTINGALILSIIDFVLSFAIISFIGFVLAMLPQLNRLGPGIAAQIQHQLPPASPREDMTEDDHIAAISAAVAAIVGAHRIVHIEPEHPGGGWLAEGRTAHHSSHDVGRHGSSRPHPPGTKN
jgi:hypothetical protein